MSPSFNDIRTPAQFKGISFSGYKKTDVISQLLDNMKKGKVEESCHWCAELISAGHFHDLWETIFYYFGKHIHLGNPKIILYLQMRHVYFQNILQDGVYISELHLRDNIKIRKLFAELISILAVSPKTHSYELVKIQRDLDFSFEEMSTKLKADSTTYSEPIIKKGDPKEIHVAINEFAYHISTASNNTMLACYWIEWIIDFEQVCKKRKVPCIADYRAFVKVASKYNQDLIWIVWDALFYYGKESNKPHIEKLLESLFYIFSSDYTSALCKKRRFLLYFAVNIITQPVNMAIEIISDKEVVSRVIERINTIYDQIMENQVTPKTHYLLDNIQDEHSRNESMNKLDIMNQMQQP